MGEIDSRGARSQSASYLSSRGMCLRSSSGSERLCHACPPVSVSVRSALVRRVDRSLLFARNCCHLLVLLSSLLSVEKFSIQTNEQLLGTSEEADDSVLYAFMTMEKDSWAHLMCPQASGSGK